MDKIKVLHTGDFHLGYDYGKYEEHSVERARENIDTFGRVVDLCHREQVDVMLIAGDLFDNDNPKENIVRYVIEGFKRIEEVIVMIAPGNHDYYKKGSFYDRIGTLCENVFIFDGEMDFYEFNIKGNTVRIYGAGFTAPIMPKTLMGQRKIFRDISINLGVFHGEIGLEGANSKYAPMSLKQIEQNCFDYLALGHIHKQTEVLQAGRTNYAYCGCPEGLNFGTQGIKGVYIGEVGQGYADMEYIRTCRRMYLEHVINVSGGKENISGSYTGDGDEVSIDSGTVTVMAEQIRSRFCQMYGTGYRDNLYKIMIAGEVPDRQAVLELESELGDIYNVSVNIRENVKKKTASGKTQRGRFIINSIHIVNFGGLKNYRMSFDEGFQIIYGENEFGKSTVMAFIKMMLYGCASKSKDISQNLRKKYQPFDGSLMKGSMEFTLNDRHYIVEREFGKSKSYDVCRVIDTDNGIEIPLSKEYEVGDYFLSIPQEDFNKTIFAGNMTGITDTGAKSALFGRIAGLSDELEESTDVTAELAEVTKKMEHLISKIGTSGKIPEINERIEEYKRERDRLCEEQEYFTQSAEPDKEGLKREKKVICNLIRKMERLEETADYEEKTEAAYFKAQKNIMTFFMAAVIVCAAAGAAWCKNNTYDVLIYAGGIIFEGILLIKRTRIKKKIKKCISYVYDEKLQERIDVIMEEFGYNNYSIEDLEDRLNKIDEMLSQTAGWGNEKIDQRVRVCEERITELRQKKNALLKQYDELKTQAEQFKSLIQQAGKQITVPVNERAAQLFSWMSGKKYEGFMVDEDFNILVKQHDSAVYEDWRYLSTASSSQAYLSLRISLCEMVGDGNVILPLLFDDILCSYDEKRIRKTIDILKQLDTQVILFTCHRWISEAGGQECPNYMRI